MLVCLYSPKSQMPYADVLIWLAFICDISIKEIEYVASIKLIIELKNKGFIEKGYGLYIHDLFTDFAESRANGTGKWVSLKNAVEIPVRLQQPLSNDRPRFEALKLDNCLFQSLAGINYDLLRNVSVLHLQDMAILKTLDLTPMKMLRNLTIIKCLELENIRGIQGLSNLCYFIIKGCHRDLRFPGVECLMALRHLEVDSENSNNWPIKVSPGLSQSSNLEFLRLSGLRNLEEFPSFTGFTNLVTFVLERMPNLKELPSFTGLPKLATLELRELQSLKEDPSSLGELTGSRPLMLSEMPNLTEHLEEFPCLSGWSNLRVLVLHNMEKLRVLSSFAELTGLRSLSLGDMPHLEEVPCLSGLSNLRELLLDKMEKLRVLPSFAELTGLVRLILGKMPHLEEVPCLSGLSELTNLKCVTLMKLPKVRDVPRVIGLSDCRHIWWHEMGQTLLLRFRFHELFGLQHLNWAKMPYLEECELLRLTMLICGTMIEVFRELPCLNGFNEFREFKLERVANLRVANLGCIIAIHSNHHI